MSRALRVLANSPLFQHGITAVILLAGLVVGLETDPGLVARWGDTLHLLNEGILAIFIVEIAVKMGAEGRRPWRYFRDPWNVFDFAIVAACLLPFGSGSVAVVRILRLLRVLRLLRALPRLQLLVNALLKSVPSMAYVSLLLFLLFYVYGVAGVFLFRENDPVHFGNLGLSLVSLFRVVTLEDWTDILYIGMYGCASYGYEGREALCTDPSARPLLAVAFFVSFVLLGTMIMLNLFIGVIMSGMDEAQRERDGTDSDRAEGSEAPHVGLPLLELREQLGAVQESVRELSEAVRGLSAPVPSEATGGLVRVASGPEANGGDEEGR